MRRIEISEDSLAQWKKDLAELDKKIQEINHRRLVLSRRIEAFPLFFEEAEQPPNWKQPQFWNDRFEIPTNATIPDAIRAVLRAVPEKVTKRTLRSLLLEKGLSKEKLGTRFALFYTALSRMRENREVVEDKDGWLQIVNQDDDVDEEGIPKF